MDNLIKITNDLFDVSSRLKSIRESYELYYNAEKRRYEVHDREQSGTALAFAVPFDELDARTVDYALKTSVRNAERLFAEIDRANRQAERAEYDEQINKAMSLCGKRRRNETC